MNYNETCSFLVRDNHFNDSGHKVQNSIIHKYLLFVSSSFSSIPKFNAYIC